MAKKINITIAINPDGILDKFPMGSLTTEAEIQLAAKHLLELLADKYIHSFYSDGFTEDELNEILEDIKTNK